MYWTHELMSHLANAPFPATRADLIDYAERNWVPIEVLENLKELPDDESIYYQSTDDLWPDRFDYDELNHLDDEDDFF